MKLPALFDYDHVKTVDAADLKRLIAQGRILAFRRSSGWVRIGSDPIRGDGGDYGGPERREIRQHPLPEPDQGMHCCLLGGALSGKE